MRKRRPRRILAMILVVLGGALMLLAPEIWAGLGVLVLGVLLELAGIALRIDEILRGITGREEGPGEG